MLQHLLRVKVREEERYIISLGNISLYVPKPISITHLDWFPPQYEEGFGSLCEKPRELVYKDMFYFIGLLDLDADSDAVDARFNKDSLVFISRNGEGVQQHFW